jgi:UDP-glucose 4-epimerase
MVEQCLAFQRRLARLEPVVLRVSNAYGEGQAGNRGQGVIATFVADALAGRPLRVLGDGSAVRDYVHVADVAAAVLAALHYRGEHRVFNVGSGIGHSIDEVVAALERALGTRVLVGRIEGRPFDVPTTCSTAASRRANWLAGAYRVRRGSRSTIAWQRGAR